MALLLLVLFAALLLPGLFGRDPWKSDEAYSFGLVYHVVRTGDWVVPTLGGEPFMEKPMAFYLLAAGCSRLGSPPLAMPDGARLASGLCMALTLLFVGLASRAWNGRGRGWPAAVLLGGTVGLLYIAHLLVTDLALLTGFAIALYGLALGARRPLAGGLLLGTGAGLGFMSKGLIAPGMLGPLVLLLPLLAPPWRRRGYFVLLAAAALAALPWLTVWPLALYGRSPADFMTWFWTNNLGRFMGSSHLGGDATPFYCTRVQYWFAWPLWPLALWALWRERGRGLLKPEVLVPLAAYAVCLSVLNASAYVREIYALPALVPLAVLAARGVDALPARAARIANGVATAVAGVAAAGLWAGWLVQMTGWPPALAHRILAKVPDYVPAFSAGLFLVALLATGLWVWLVTRRDGPAAHPALRWTGGVALVWLLVMTLWLPMANANMSYRPLIASLRVAIPAGAGPIASEGLGEPQRALFEYYGGIVTQRRETKDVSRCPLYLIQALRRTPAPPPGRWRLLWEGRHGGREVYHLYQRITGP